MQFSDIPRGIRRVWASAASSAYVRSVPDTGSTGGIAAYDVGFPPATFLSESSGGIPPDGKDVNGVLLDVTGWARWAKAGGAVTFDSAFATATGGYPKYALLASTTSGKLWQSSVDNNTTDPDGGSAAGWISVSATFGTDANSITYPDGKVDQWGRVAFSSTSEPVVSVALAHAYANGSYNVTATPIINGASSGKDTWIQVILGSISTSGFSVQYQRGAGETTPGLDGFYWRTIGK